MDRKRMKETFPSKHQMPVKKQNDLRVYAPVPTSNIAITTSNTSRVQTFN
jgi:hypothetical protein